MKGEPAHVVSAVDDNTPEQFKPMDYPFDFAWKKVEKYKNSKKKINSTVVENPANCRQSTLVASGSDNKSSATQEEQAVV